MPGGDLEIRREPTWAACRYRGRRRGTVGGPEFRRPVAMLGDLAAPVLLSRGSRLTLRVPEEAESGRLRILQNGAQSNAVEVRVASLIATGSPRGGQPGDGSGREHLRDLLGAARAGDAGVGVSHRAGTGRCGPLCAGS